jgi:hypothetical protein
MIGMYMYKWIIIISLWMICMIYYVQNKTLSEGFSTNRYCPNLLIQKGTRIYLKNTRLAEVPGVNPMTFNNLEEYVEFTEWQRSQGINCEVLYLKHEYDAQGNGVYKVRPDILDTAGGSQAIPPGNIGSIDTVSIPTDTPEIHSSVLPPTNNYTGYDPDNQDIGKETALDSLYNIELTQSQSDNAMDPNWGGEEYSDSIINSGYYVENTRST